MKKKTTITHTIAEAAIKRFLKKGGLIQRLPPQQCIRRTVVGIHHGTFEDPIDFWGPGSLIFNRPITG